MRATSSASARWLLLSLVLPCAAGCGDGSWTAPDAGGRGDGGGLERDASPDVDGGIEPVDAAATVDAASPIDGGAPTSDAGPIDCPPPPSCDAPLPSLGPTTSWRHSIQSAITTGSGAARHRGRDLFLRQSDPQWALAKFAYGYIDDDLQDEDVDLYLLRGCGSSWEMLGSATTTEDDSHDTIEGVEDTGGRVYFEIPASARLGLGRHRIAFVVRGDHTIADQFIEVLPDDARFIVTDVDGTQTESETAEYGALLTGSGPDAQPHGAELVWAFSQRGYHIFYLTARPDWLHTRTHTWLEEQGYPPGVVHTTLGSTGAMGSAAESFKTEELEALHARFPAAIDYAIGNTDTDAAAFSNAGIAPEHAYLLQYDPGPLGTRVEAYAPLLPTVRALGPRCL